jgi:hypothetical protein
MQFQLHLGQYTNKKLLELELVYEHPMPAEPVPSKIQNFKFNSSAF